MSLLKEIEYHLYNNRDVDLNDERERARLTKRLLQTFEYYLEKERKN